MNYVVFTELYCLYWTIKIRQTKEAKFQQWIRSVYIHVVFVNLLRELSTILFSLARD